MILKEQVLALTSRRNEYEKAGAYYEGDVPEVFTTAGLRRAMRSTGYAQRLNFCRPVIDAVQSRLEIAAILGTSQKASKVIADTWEFNELGLDSNDIHRHALTYGDTYVMVWPDEDGNLEVSYNSPLNTVIVYDPEHPRRKLYAVKMWVSEDGSYLNIYTADEIQKFYTDSKEVTDGTQWRSRGTVENPFGEIPVFHLRTMRPFGRPEHKDAYDAQDYINKQFIQSMVTADYQGAPQRYAIRKATEGNEVQDFNEGDTERENSGALQNGPGKLWDLVGYDKVGQFDPADPENFWMPITNTVRSMASLTNTPLHYFEKTGNVPSGEALRVAEAPLVKKVNDRQAAFGQAWRDIFKFVLKANGIDGDVQVKWKEVESLDEPTRWDTTAKKVNVGVSKRQALRELGYDEEVIDQILEEADEEKASSTVSDYGRQSSITTNTNPNVRVQPENDERNVDA